MKLEGIHHITAITGDARANVDFYVRVLGLRMVKKTVNQDDPTIYHLFYGDEEGSPGMDLTFFEYPGAAPGQAGDGMVHRVVWRVGSQDAIDFWEERLRGEEAATERTDAGTLIFADREGLRHELAVVDVPDKPLLADAPDVPAELALQGFDGVRAYASDPDRSARLLEAMGFEAGADGDHELRGDERGGRYVYDEPPPQPAHTSAGTVHHIAFASRMEDHEDWRERVLAAGARATEVIDRFYFRSIYFREPSGVLFEIATIGPGFTADEDAATLGERLSLPPRFEPLREQLERTLTPLPDPRPRTTTG
jgi:glyoxalase family protein